MIRVLHVTARLTKPLDCNLSYEIVNCPNQEAKCGNTQSNQTNPLLHEKDMKYFSEILSPSLKRIREQNRIF